MWQMDANWKNSLDSPVASSMSVVKKILTSRRWWTLAPDQSVFASGLDNPSTLNFACGMRPSNTLNAAARSVEGNCLMIYLSSPSTVSIYMDKITAGNRVKATWVNPQTGAETPAGEFPNTGTQSFTSLADSPDAVLILDAVR
jgi:hypothetical protein